MFQERVGQEQHTQEIVAVQLRKEEDHICQEKEKVAEDGAQGEAQMAQEGVQDGIAGPTTESSKSKKSNKRSCVVISSELDDVDAASEVEEGDGKKKFV